MKTESVLESARNLGHITITLGFAAFIAAMVASGCGTEPVGQGDVEVATPAPAPDPRFTAPGNPDSPPCLGCGYAATAGESKSVAPPASVTVPSGFTLPLDLSGTPLKAYPAYSALCRGGDVSILSDCRSQERVCTAPENSNVAVGSIDRLWCSDGTQVLILICPLDTSGDTFTVGTETFAGCR